MAAPSKRSKANPKSKKKKTVTKKHRSTRRGKAKTRSNRKVLIRWVIAGLVVVGLAIVVGYSYMKSKQRSGGVAVDNEVIYPYSQKEILKELSHITAKHPKKNHTKEAKYTSSKTSLKRHSNATSGSRHRTINEAKLKRKTTKKQPEEQHSKFATRKRKNSKTTLAYRGKRPKLVIIIDDVHTRAQIEEIRALPFSVTPSIFPPYSLAKHSEKLAEGLRHYMIHLPMESGSTQFNKQTKTLMRSFSKSQIHKRIKELRRLFPDAAYINNHTGSTFTSSYRAMKQLYDILKLEGFDFVDSFTVGSSKVKKIAHEEGDAYIRRDIFIDNKQNIGYILKQLKKAVRIAKRKGYAIAIGHPHKTTIGALEEAKPILKGIDVVYIDQIYKRK